LNYDVIWRHVLETIVVARTLSEVRTKFWGAKTLWHCERHYVATPNMEVWKRLACLAPDEPDGWSFPDVGKETWKSWFNSRSIDRSALPRKQSQALCTSTRDILLCRFIQVQIYIEQRAPKQKSTQKSR
jgi:hypothetical protein